MNKALPLGLDIKIASGVQSAKAWVGQSAKCVGQSVPTYIDRIEFRN